MQFQIVSSIIPLHIHQEMCMYKCCITAPDWVDALIYIGAVASGIILPLGLSIIIYHYCKDRQRGTVILR